MSSVARSSIHRIRPNEASLLGELLAVFGDVFGEVETYSGARPGPAYLERLLASDTFMALVACKGGAVVGGLAAYELRKFERVRSEIYLYDLAVAASHRRQGIATALIDELQVIAGERGAHVIFRSSAFPGGVCVRRLRRTPTLPPRAKRAKLALPNAAPW